jgi:gamma-glutamyltranspeptidase/glutathione hydrolase
VYYNAQNGAVHAIDSTSRAPKNFDPEKFNLRTSKHGYLAVGVPGNVAGIDLALQTLGTLPFKTLAQSAIALAENGVVVTPKLAGLFRLLSTIDPLSRRAVFPNGVPRKGELWFQKDLGRLMRRLGDDGPASFYQGEIAAQICKQVQEQGGSLAVEDFREFSATAGKPLHIQYRGNDLYTPPLPSGGITTLEILKTLEQFELPKHARWGAPYFELFAGAAGLAWADRERYCGDPDFVDVPVAELLSKKRAKAHADALRKGYPRTQTRASEASHTVNVLVIDKDHNVASWTATHGDSFGAQVAIEGLGLMLGHGMSRFDLTKDSPNAPAPRKRPHHNMAPIIVLRDGNPVAGIGMPGGPRIVNVTAQIAVSLLDFGASPEEAVNAPRLHTENPKLIQVSQTMPAGVIDQLRGHGLNVEYLNPVGGLANAAVIDNKTGHVEAAASQGSDGVLMF